MAAKPQVPTMTVHAVNPKDCILYMKTVQGGAVRALIEALNHVIHEALFEIDETGVRLLKMDGAQCCMVNVKLHAHKFQEFKCVCPVDTVTNVKSPLTLGVCFKNLLTLLRNVNGPDTITFYMYGARTNELGIIVQSSEHNSSTDSKLFLQTIDFDNWELDSATFDSVISMKSPYFQRLCRDASAIASHITIESRLDNRLVLSCRGDFATQETVIGSSEEDPDESDPTRTTIKTTKAVKDTFNLAYLQKFCKATGLCPVVEIYMKEAFPLILKYNVANLGELKFCLAADVVDMEDDHDDHDDWSEQV